MKHEADITPGAARQPDAADFTRARAGYAAGAGVDHVVVGAWLLTWGDPGYKDFPDWLAEQDG